MRKESLGNLAHKGLTEDKMDRVTYDRCLSRWMTEEEMRRIVKHKYVQGIVQIHVDSHEGTQQKEVEEEITHNS